MRKLPAVAHGHDTAGSPRLQWFALLSPAAARAGSSTATRQATSLCTTPTPTPSSACPPSTALRVSCLSPCPSPAPVHLRRTSTSCTPSPPWGGRASTSSGSACTAGRWWGAQVVVATAGTGTLPPPPLATLIGAHAVLDGGRTICVSAAPRHMGTYCFDTVRGEWWQAADDWELPFDGRAEYVPDLKLWLGFASGTHQLCASSDLSAAAAAAAGAKPPTLKHVPGLDTPPTEWKAVANPKPLSLGSGRFCIAKVFQAARNTPSGGDFPDLAGERFAVLTGVEMRAGSGDNKPGVEMLGGSGDSKAEEEDGQGLQLVKHKSILYAFLDGNGRIDWVL